jgi:hypothetical protein
VEWGARGFGCGGRARNFLRVALFLLILLIPSVAGSLPEVGADVARQQQCRRMVLTGEVAAGREWKAAIGEGWVFRVLPIGPPYTGWDLVVDREQGGRYPDALLLGTPPYGSLNEREIGTTYGLRAQDAIAWGPRRFHFLTSSAELERARGLFQAVMPSAGMGAVDAVARRKATAELLRMLSGEPRLGAGEFTVRDARLIAGVADPPEFARQWAMHLSQIPHTLEQTMGSAAPSGKLLWIRFEATLELPARWKTRPGQKVEMTKCAQ